MTHPTPLSVQLDALRQLGRAWSVELGYTDVERLHPLLERRLDGLWYPSAAVVVLPAFPQGLTIEQALGFTVAVRWSETDRGNPEQAHPARADVTTTEHGRRWWFVRLPVGAERHLPAREALATTRALLTIRRILWPTRPWGPRDPIAEGLQLQVRAMEADLRPALPIEVFTPALILSDLGRDWR